MRTRSALVTAATVLAAGAGGTPAAEAAVSWAACTPAGFECAALSVPLDRAGRTPGSVVLRVKRRVATGGAAARTAVVALAGGPGQAALPAAADFAELMAPGLADRDLLVLDQRGTGASGRLRCRAFERGATSIVAAARSCALQLGPARAFYRTADSVADLEDLRREAGYEQVLPFGVSYGTKLALDYAAAYPARTAGLILDSVVPPEGSDVFNRTTFGAMGRALRHLCAGGACRASSRAPLRDLRRLVVRMSGRALRGVVVLPSGRRARTSATTADLYQALVGGDLNPVLRADLPGAVRAALRGDPAPALRLMARAEGLSGIPAERARTGRAAAGSGGAPLATTAAAPEERDSDALFAATRCEESRLPWPRGAGVSARARQAARAALRLPRSATYPFTPAVALLSEVIPLCLGWPHATPAPAAPRALPAVPALLLDGAADLRTPLEDARAVARRIPGAQVVEVPDTGHSALGSDLSDCATGAVAAFFAGTPPTACPRRPVVAPGPLAPRSLGAVAGRTRVRRTLSALRATVADVARSYLSDALAAGRTPPAGSRTGGLRSGSARYERAGFRLRGVEYVPGVAVSGFAPRSDGATAAFTVGGRAAARGRVRVAPDGRVTGRLGGRRVATTFGVARAAHAGPRSTRLPPFPRVAALG
jgi:pimeloyl-ACP methyl ester carboxylesterase